MVVFFFLFNSEGEGQWVPTGTRVRVVLRTTPAREMTASSPAAVVEPARTPGPSGGEVDPGVRDDLLIAAMSFPLVVARPDVTL
ncbi:hypothetical protein Acsp03_68380 [Actinomadura sp. NBRC 104412]|nr:hypothetical protein Acsp03_68380 [Actinomadura sp. NBRC 104412]